METPFISFKCITAGRTAYLEEQIQSFLQQDYPEDKLEMVIVNDYPEQTLVFDHPRIRIYNRSEVFVTLGQKENYATILCRGELIAQTDDDDIALPNHAKNIAKFFKENTDLLHWRKACFFNHPNIDAITDVGNSGIVYRKSSWEKFGMYPHENAGYDKTFVQKFHEFGNIVYAAPEDLEVSWFYRWFLPNHGGVFHNSGQGTDTPDRPNILVRHAAHLERLKNEGLNPTGIVHLKPHWNIDYKKLLEEFNSKN